MSQYLSFKEGLAKEDIELIIVSKQQSIDKIKSFYNEGARHFGENRVSELLEKAHDLPGDITWHYVGKLQKNKIGKILKVSPIIHSIDSLELAQALELKATKPLKGFLQVNVSKEESKSGIYLEELKQTLEEVSSFSNLEIIGLMTMAPIDINKDKLLELFKKLKDQETLFNQIMHRKKCYFSMGMSQDYREAITCGATHIRIGRAIFTKS